MGVQSVQRCKGFRLLCSRKKNVMGMNAGSSISESRNALKGDNMSIKNVYAQIVSFDNLLQAEKDARAGKDMKMSS